MPPEISACLYDVLTAIEEVEIFIAKADYEVFLSNRLLQTALEREFEIIGEALNRILRFDEAYLSGIHDYMRIIGFRNVIAHGYDTIKYEILWDAATKKITRLKKDVTLLLGKNSAY